jgi:RimJ/RimL family protein N-acetyltransferase
MTFSVRPARVADVDAIVDHYCRVADEGRWIAGEAPVDREGRRVAFLGSIGADDVLMLVVEDERGRIVGMLSAFAHQSGVAELGMSVDADRRGRGIGTALLEACIDWARAEGLHKLSLEVFPHNEPALSLYRKVGFEEEGRLRAHYRRASGELWDAIDMGLLL